MPHMKKLVIRGFKSFPRETEILLDRTMNCVVGPNGSGKSCSYDTNVLLSNGREMQIGDLVENQIKSSKEIRKLDDGIYVNGDNSIEIISLNRDTLKPEKKKVSKFIKRDGEIIYKIKTRTGKEVKATGCHPVMIFSQGKVRSTLIRDLDKGELIATPRIINIEGEPYNPELARLMGYIIGDGYISKYRIEFINQDKEVIEDYKNILNHLNLKFTERKDKNAARIYINDSAFYKRLKNLFILNHEGSITSEIKKIPEVLLSTNKESISNLLAGLYDTDGSVRKDIAVIEFCTKNKSLANQIQGLLLRFGIISKIKKRVCCAYNTEDKIKRDYYYIYIYGKDNLERFYLNIPLRVKHKKEKIKLHLAKESITNPNTDLLPREINLHVKEVSRLLGIKYKPLRKQYPFFAAYIEDRCLPTRQGISKILPLFFNKLAVLELQFNNIRLEQNYLVDSMDYLNISGQQASREIGLSKQIIRDHWATNRFNARPENLEKFYELIKTTFTARIFEIKKLLAILVNIANSDIYWDEIVSIETLEKEPYVYDLTIEENHNFIANNIFVHNSNLTDAICFVLGRMSIKSMRAEKATNLIFAGTKVHKPANEASVELVFDNSDKSFALPESEVSLKRIVRRNGQGVYKINNVVKTRQEILELLAQAGIDPYGFNIVLQGEIDSFVKMHGEERRKIIEEVAGISVYETRKQKALSELDKTEEKLREVSAVLRERTAYLKNLENERQQALKFKKLEETAKRCRASILKRRLDDKSDEKEKISDEVAKKNSALEKVKASLAKLQEEIKNLNAGVEDINNKIQKSSGVEQDSLHTVIADLKASIAGLEVRKENFQNQIDTLVRRKEELEKSIANSEKEIEEMQKTKGKSRKQEFVNKKATLEDIEERRRKFYSYKSSLDLIHQRIEDKKKELQKVENESLFVFKKIEEIEASLDFKDPLEKNKSLVAELKGMLEESKKKQGENEKIILSSEKQIAAFEKQLEELEEIKKQVASLDICPLCKTKITPEHIGNISEESNEKISALKKDIELSEKNRGESWELKENLILDIRKMSAEIEKRDRDILKLESINEKKQAFRGLEQEKKAIVGRLAEIESEKERLEKIVLQHKGVEEDYDSLKLEVDELARHEEANVGMEVTLKQRELDRMKLLVKQSLREKEEMEQEISGIISELEGKQEDVEQKEKQEAAVQEKFKKMILEKNKMQDKIRFFESDLLRKQNDCRIIEDEINNFKIKIAEFNAQLEGLGLEYKEFEGVELIKIPVQQLQEKLDSTQQILGNIGNVNLRALEVYDNIKKEYDTIAEKVNTLGKEKEEILKIIAEIDHKKRKTFNKTLYEINSLFSRNFAQLSTKGIASLDPENKEDLFAGGLDIIIKVGKGKYFDVTSLSGGEQTLIALSLIFAIQEYRPYSFYIFDEIDAALDKRNSERLAMLLKKYLKAGQYLVITHNDALITEASTLYGVSMQEGISKVLSMQI